MISVGETGRNAYHDSASGIRARNVTDVVQQIIVADLLSNENLDAGLKN